MQKILFSISCFFLLIQASTITNARTVADVNVPDQVTVNDQPLILNGSGMREKFFFDIYVAALYLSKPAHDTKAVLASKGPRRVLMHFVYSEIDRDKLVDAWNEGFDDNLTKSELASLRPRIEKFNGFFASVHRNDVIILDYIPGTGTKVTINNQEKGQIPGQDFNNALLSIWLGHEPVTKSLKNALLGK